MNDEINMLEQQLQDEQENNDAKSKRVAKLEKDIRDLRVQVEQKIEISKYRKNYCGWLNFLGVPNFCGFRGGSV